MRHFVGRVEQLAKIEDEWAAARDLGEGRMVTIRGRRRVGKTSLVEEFIERTKAPNLFFAASGHTEERELDLFGHWPFRACRRASRPRVLPSPPGRRHSSRPQRGLIRPGRA